MKSFLRIQSLILLVIISIISMISIQSCTERIDAGHVGIKVNLYGTEKGVDDVTEVTGRVWYNPMTTEIHEIPTYMQNAVWTKDAKEGSANDDSITFQTSEGMEIGADIALNYSFIPGKVPEIFKRFRKSPSQLEMSYLRTQVRNLFVEAASGYTVENFIQRKGDFLKEVKQAAKNKLEEEGFYIDTLTFIGSPRYPGSVVASIQNKIKATQVAEQKERELEQAVADAAKVTATATGAADAKIQQARGEAQSILLKAEAEAKAIKQVRTSLTKDYIEYIRATRWDGKYPTTMAGENTGFLLDIGK